MRSIFFGAGRAGFALKAFQHGFAKKTLLARFLFSMVI